jgi:HK97 family phage portal protein
MGWIGKHKEGGADCAWMRKGVQASGRAVQADQPVSADATASIIYGTMPATAAGVEVTPETALQSTAVLACVRNISEDIAKYPVRLKRRDKSDPRTATLATDDPRYWLMMAEPNPYQTAFEFKEWMQASALVYGYGIAEIERDRFGMPVRLWPLHSRSVNVLYSGGELLYYVSWYNQDVHVLRSDQVLHIKGFSVHGLMGSAYTVLGREAIGLDRAHAEYSARFYGNGAAPRGALEIPGKLSQEGQSRLRTNWNDTYSGLGNAQRVAILEEGMKFNPIGVNPKDSQVIEGRQFQVSEVCRIFRMQPHKIFELARSTNNNIQQQAIENNEDTLAPHMARWTQRLDKCLLLPSEKQAHSLYHEFETGGLRWADSTVQKDYIQAMVGFGVLSINEGRKELGLNPVAGGDVHRVQVNTAPLGSAVANGEAAGKSAAGGEKI